MNTTMQGSRIITATNYMATHGAEKFKRFVEELDAEFVERKASGVYVIAATVRTVAGIANFAGFDAQRIGKFANGMDGWVLQRAPGVRVVDYVC